MKEEESFSKRPGGVLGLAKIAYTDAVHQEGEVIQTARWVSHRYK